MLLIFIPKQEVGVLKLDFVVVQFNFLPQVAVNFKLFEQNLLLLRHYRVIVAKLRLVDECIHRETDQYMLFEKITYL